MHQLARVKLAFATARPVRSLQLYMIAAVGFVLAGQGWENALIGALPMLSICLAGFCINDIYDQEMDRINHPERVLAKFPALSKITTTIYVVLFVVSISLISLQEGAVVKFLWSIILILLSNYNFFKRNIPILKNAYIAITACVVASIFGHGGDFQLPNISQYIPLFISVFARELSLDVLDSAGDKGTLALFLGSKLSVAFAMFLYIAEALLTILLSSTYSQTLIASFGLIAVALYILMRITFGISEESLRPVSGLIVVVPAILIIA
jgi:4-hydroxybenzoate polyprenyltransferase